MSPLAADPARGNRLTYDDDLFLRARRVLGIPVVNQTVWRLPGPVPEDWLGEVHAALARGPLTRLLVGPRVPGARARWVRGVAPPLGPQEVDVPDEGVLAWADRLAGVDLDPVLGPTWQLAAARTRGGEGLLSLVTSHVVCDGGLHVGAFVAAAGGRALPRLPVDDLGLLQVRRRADLRDALHRGRAAGRGVRTVLRQRRDGAPVVPDPGVVTSTSRPAPPARGGDDARAYRPPTVVVSTSAEAWERAARACGGTANSLLVAVAAEVLVEAGRVPAGAALKVALPVDTRSPEVARDLRSNATTGVSVVVDTDADGRVRDLATVRARSREAFAGLAAGRRADPLDPLKPLLQALPDRAMARLARSSAVPLCLASNLGTLTGRFRSPYGVPATSVLMRSVTQGVTPDLMRSRRGGLSTWWSRHAGPDGGPDLVTQALLGLDPDCWPDADALRGHVAATYARWGLTADFW